MLRDDKTSKKGKLYGDQDSTNYGNYRAGWKLFGGVAA
jgi:hypothetical protein